MIEIDQKNIVQAHLAIFHVQADAFPAFRRELGRELFRLNQFLLRF